MEATGNPFAGNEARWEPGEPQGGIEPPTCALPRRRSTTKPLRQCGAQTSERHKYSPTTPAGIVRTTLCDSPGPQEERTWRVLRPARVGGDDGAVYGSREEGLRTLSSPPSRRQRSASGATSRGTPRARWPKPPES